MGYIAYVLDEPSRAKVLKLFTPRYPDVICHHVTLAVGVNALLLPRIIEDMATALVNVAGWVYDDRIDALIVSVGGKYERHDGGIYHITNSIDRSKGAKPVMSNLLVSDRKNWDLNRGMCFITGSVQYFN